MPRIIRGSMEVSPAKPVQPTSDALRLLWGKFEDSTAENSRLARENETLRIDAHRNVMLLDQVNSQLADLKERVEKIAEHRWQKWRFICDICQERDDALKDVGRMHAVCAGQERTFAELRMLTSDILDRMRIYLGK